MKQLSVKNAEVVCSMCIFTFRTRTATDNDRNMFPSLRKIWFFVYHTLQWKYKRSCQKTNIQLKKKIIQVHSLGKQETASQNLTVVSLHAYSVMQLSDKSLLFTCKPQCYFRHVWISHLVSTCHSWIAAIVPYCFSFFFFFKPDVKGHHNPNMQLGG